MAGFFNKVVAEVNKGVTNVGANSKALVEKTKVNTTIGNLEKECNKLFQDLGKQVYNLHQSNDEVMANEGVLNLILEVHKRNELIEQQQEQLILIGEEAKLTMENAMVAAQNYSVSSDKTPIKCACGYDNLPEVKFCAKCGNSVELVHEVIVLENNTVKCACGFDNAVGAAFCGDCGSKI